MFRHLEDLRDKYEGEEIWVLGRGPSLDDYPIDFFDDKISIAINYAYIAFPNCTYYHSFHAESAEWVSKNWPDKFDRCILGCHHGSHPRDGWRRNRFEGSGEAPVYVKIKWGTGLDSNRFRKPVERIIAKESCELINSITTLHTAIQVAIILGAKKVTLVGCELKIKNGLLHAKSTWADGSYERRFFRAKERWHRERFFPGSLKGLQWLVEICKPHGIEIVRYSYGKGYEQIEVP